MWNLVKEVTFTTLKNSTSPSPGEKDENLLYVVQVSDIHVSQFHEPQRIADFAAFCERTLPLIRPELVLVTGDLTDAKTFNKLGFGVENSTLSAYIIYKIYIIYYLKRFIIRYYFIH